MPQLKIEGIDTPLFLIPYDAKGNEVAGRTGHLTSQQAVNELAGGSVTDVFIISHGWLADYPAAVSQYTRWAGAMAACTADIAQIKQARPGFKPLLIGVHWPSLPFADKELGGPTVPAEDFGFLDLVSLVDDYASRLVGAASDVVDEAKDALGKIVDTA